MTEQEAILSVRRLYWLTGSFGLLGFVWYLAQRDPAAALAFLLGTLGSLANLWLYERLSRRIAPGAHSRKPWEAGAFIGRYLILFTVGYVIVKDLGVNPLAVVLGLLTSTAAILASILFELVQSVKWNKNSG